MSLIISVQTVIANDEIRLPSLSSLGKFGLWVWVFPLSPFVTISPIALNHAEMETVKLCAQRAVHMCWLLETSPQEFLAVCYKNWLLCAEWRDRALGVVLRGSLCQPARPRGKGQTLIQAGEPPGDVDLCPVLEGAFLVRSIGAVRGS